MGVCISCASSFGLPRGVAARRRSTLVIPARFRLLLRHDGWGTATLQAVRLIAQREIPAFAGMTGPGGNGVGGCGNDDTRRE